MPSTACLTLENPGPKPLATSRPDLANRGLPRLGCRAAQRRREPFTLLDLETRTWQRSGYLWLAYAFSSGCFVLARWNYPPYDDAHFFKRVAVHALETGQLAWNVDEGPTYGMTSLLFQGLVVPVVALARDHYMLAVRVLSWITAVATYALLLAMTRRMDRGLSATWLLLTPAALFPLLSGMETATSLLAVSGVLWLALSPIGRRAHWSLCPLATVGVYLLRPDATLLVAPVMLATRWAERRRVPVREGLVLGVGLVAVSVACASYFGTPLPLPFYAKQAALSPYGAHFIEVSRPSSLQRAAVFGLFALPALAAGVARRDLVNVTLLLSVVAHGLFHLVSTVDIMGMHGRFYAPAIPLLAVASARGLQHLDAHGYPRAWHVRHAAVLFFALFAAMAAIKLLPVRAAYNLDSVEPAFYVAGLPAFGFALWSVGRAGFRARAMGGLLLATALGGLAMLFGHSPRLHSDDDFLTVYTARFTTVRGIDAVRKCLGDRIHVYHSEIGIPGLRFVHGKVTDLVGLQSPRWLFREPGSFDALCLADRPEAIFLPHRNYRELNREIQQGRCIQDYRQVVESSSSPLFIRQDLHPQFLDCARAAKARWVVSR